MAEVTAALVKQLREQTGAGMMDCKTALIEAEGDLEAATAGVATAAPASSPEPVTVVQQRLDATPRNLLDALREATTRRA